MTRPLGHADGHRGRTRAIPTPADANARSHPPHLDSRPSSHRRRHANTASEAEEPNAVAANHGARHEHETTKPRRRNPFLPNNTSADANDAPPLPNANANANRRRRCENPRMSHPFPWLHTMKTPSCESSPLSFGPFPPLLLFSVSFLCIL